MKVCVVLQVPYVVEVETTNQANAIRAVEANWETVYKHAAQAEHFPPNLTGKVVRVEPA